MANEVFGCSFHGSDHTLAADQPKCIFLYLSVWDVPSVEGITMLPKQLSPKTLKKAFHKPWVVV